MALPVLTEQIRCPRPLHANRTDRWLLGIFFFLSFFELPVVWIGTDSIGLYDVYLIGLTLYLLLRTRGFAMHMPWAWRSYFLVFLGYLSYLFFNLLLLVDFRSEAILFKTAETMLIMLVLYTFFTQFDLEPKRMMRMIEINVFLLAGFQLFSFLNAWHPFIGIPPGLGVGQWYRLSLPYTAFVSPNPAGFVAGTFILLSIFSRNRRDIGRGSFLLLVLLLTLALFFTVSRTNILITVVVLVVYLLRRSLTKTRYIVAIGLFAVFVVVLVNVLVDRVPQNSQFWLVLKLVQNPSDFSSRVGSDASFDIRLHILWPGEIKAWLTNTFTFFFGNGIAYYGIADGTYTGLLANQGLVGLLFFFYLWYFHFLSVWKSRSPFLWILLLYALLNGLTADTLVTSYRSIQAYLIALFVILFAYGGLRRESQ